MLRQYNSRRFEPWLPWELRLFKFFIIIIIIILNLIEQTTHHVIEINFTTSTIIAVVLFWEAILNHFNQQFNSDKLMNHAHGYKIYIRFTRRKFDISSVLAHIISYNAMLGARAYIKRPAGVFNTTQ